MTEQTTLDRSDLLSAEEYDGLVPRVLPFGWKLAQVRGDGAAFVRDDGLSVILSAALEQDGHKWLHVSCARPNRLPPWTELRLVKAIFVGRERTALQVLPPESKYINRHPYCLHLWVCLDGEAVPDFSRGGSVI